MELVKNFLKEKNIDGIESKINKLNIFCEMLIRANEKFNLTAITEKDEIEVKHFFDSLQPADIISGSIIDVGTGAGFPALPLAIVREDCNFTLVDSLKKRVDFIEEVKNELGLNNITVLHKRAEDLDKSIKYDFAAARAVAPLNILCEYCLPFVKAGGRMLAYKGNNYLEELTAAKNAIKVLGAENGKIIKYTLNVKGEEMERYIIELKKNKETSSIYPRSGNKPRLKPL